MHHSVREFDRLHIRAGKLRYIDPNYLGADNTHFKVHLSTLALLFHDNLLVCFELYVVIVTWVHFKSRFTNVVCQ